MKLILTQGSTLLPFSKTVVTCYILYSIDCIDLSSGCRQCSKTDITCIDYPR
uniref:Uncharacterized protein n=1 Tax=Anguilla anguilla TaxID=7936 RepID=A0A0E9VGF4_ANGAN